MEKALPAIPAKRYFTIGEVSALCDVKPYVLRYWEQEFTQLRPMKRRGNRRYYQHHEVLMVRRIRELLYDQGFTISGARNRLAAAGLAVRQAAGAAAATGETAAGAAALATARDTPQTAPQAAAQAEVEPAATALPPHGEPAAGPRSAAAAAEPAAPVLDAATLRAELESIRELLAA